MALKVGWGTRLRAKPEPSYLLIFPVLTSPRGAVLLVSIAMSADGQAADPLPQIHEQLIHAAENAAAKGYVYPDRWALMGFGYGAYGTLCTLSETNRFKAAIAIGGVYNLTSNYGSVRPVERIEGIGSAPFWAALTEAGQGRMGIPPGLIPSDMSATVPYLSRTKSIRRCCS